MVLFWVESFRCCRRLSQGKGPVGIIRPHQAQQQNVQQRGCARGWRERHEVGARLPRSLCEDAQSGLPCPEADRSVEGDVNAAARNLFTSGIGRAMSVSLRDSNILFCTPRASPINPSDRNCSTHPPPIFLFFFKICQPLPKESASNVRPHPGVRPPLQDVLPDGLRNGPIPGKSIFSSTSRLRRPAGRCRNHDSSSLPNLERHTPIMFLRLHYFKPSRSLKRF